MKQVSLSYVIRRIKFIQIELVLSWILIIPIASYRYPLWAFLILRSIILFFYSFSLQLFVPWSKLPLASGIPNKNLTLIWRLTEDQDQASWSHWGLFNTTVLWIYYKFLLTLSGSAKYVSKHASNMNSPVMK